MRVLVFGDSIAYGEYDSQGGWVDRLKAAYLEEQTDQLDEDKLRVFNLSTPGEAIRHLTFRLPPEVVARRNPWDEVTEFALVIATGINDSLTHDNGEHFSSLKQFRKDLEDLYAVARLFSEKMLFVGLTPVIDDSPLLQNYRTERIWQFEQVLRSFTDSYHLPFVPLFEKFMARIEEEYLFCDGLHPSDEGHRLIYEQVAPSLRRLVHTEKARTDILGV